MRDLNERGLKDAKLAFKRGIQALSSGWTGDPHSLSECACYLLAAAYTVKRSLLLEQLSSVRGSGSLLGETVQSISALLGLQPRTALVESQSPVERFWAIVDQLQPEVETLTPEELCQLYTHALDPETLRRSGTVYTPLKIVRSIIDATFAKALETTEPNRLSVLDPACGSGVFLLECLRRFIAWTNTQTTNQQDLIRTFLEQGLCGIDIDPGAVQLTKLLVRIVVAEHTGVFDPALRAPKIQVGNALLDPTRGPDLNSTQLQALQELKGFKWHERYTAIMKQGGFRCIVGNPPYGLKRDDQLSGIENELLKQLYAEERSGKVNKYLLFLAQSYRLLASNGSLGFIVPNAWLGIQAGRTIREQLLRDQAIADIIDHGSSAFPQRGLETVTLIVNKSQKNTEISLRARNGSRSYIPVQVCLSKKNSPISIAWSPERQALLDKLTEQSLPLHHADSPFQAAIALQAYAAGKGMPPQTKAQVKSHCFHSVERKDSTYHPYLEGRDVARYSVRWSGRFLSHGPWLAEPQVLDRFKGPRVVLREVIGPAPRTLQAAYIEDTYLYNKSVLHIRPRDGSARQEELMALLALLNSPVGSFYILQCGAKSQRALFPKIVLADLASFPVPRNLFSNAKPIAAIVGGISTRKLSEKERVSSENQLNQLVAESFGLTKQEQHTLHSVLTTKEQ